MDLYGDSYGSWFSQVFASRYAAQLRSVTLDSTYQVLGLDPWYTTTVVTARRAFEQACRLSAACAAAAGGGGGAWARIGALAARLARSPVTGQAMLPDGTRGSLTVTVLTLVNLVNNAGFDPVVYRDLDAAGRALLAHNDAAPLLRLAALSLGFDDTNYPLPEFSDGLYFAVGCTDYVQLFSRTAAARGPGAAVPRRRCAASRRDTFAPFTLRQWTSLDQYTEAYSALPALAVAVAADPADHAQAAAGAAPAAGADPVRHARLADPEAARRHARRPADGALGAAGHGRQPDPRRAPGRERRLPGLDLPAVRRSTRGTCSTRTPPARRR